MRPKPVIEFFVFKLSFKYVLDAVTDYTLHGVIERFHVLGCSYSVDVKA